MILMGESATGCTISDASARASFTRMKALKDSSVHSSSSEEGKEYLTRECSMVASDKHHEKEIDGTTLQSQENVSTGNGFWGEDNHEQLALSLVGDKSQRHQGGILKKEYRNYSCCP